jgi:Sec-independent protein secretion pathway component TatC
MEVLSKIGILLIAGLCVFLWNNYAIRWLVHKVVKLNPGNIWLAEKKHIITKIFHGFYWFFYVFITASIIISE